MVTSLVFVFSLSTVLLFFFLQRTCEPPSLQSCALGNQKLDCLTIWRCQSKENTLWCRHTREMGTRNLSSSFIFASFKFSRDGKAREEGTRYISSSFCTFFDFSHEVRARQKGTRHLSFSFFSASFVFSRDGLAWEEGTRYLSFAFHCALIHFLPFSFEGLPHRPGGEGRGRNLCQQTL